MRHVLVWNVAVTGRESEKDSFQVCRLLINLIKSSESEVRIGRADLIRLELAFTERPFSKRTECFTLFNAGFVCWPVSGKQCRDQAEDQI